MRQVALLVVVVACKATDDFPVDPNTNPDQTHLRDAGAPSDVAVVVDADANAIAGRVCLITDPRVQSACAATGAGGLTVKLETATAITSATGAFSIAKPSGSSPVWHVTGPKLQPSVVPFGASTLLPAMLAADYTTLEDDNGVTLQDATEGEIFVRIVRAGAPLAKVRATSSPAGQYGVLYDTAIGDTWLPNAANGTGAAGMLWLPGTPIGLATVTITPMGGAPIAVPNIPVESQAITWVAVDAP